MIKVSIFYPYKEREEFDFEYYNTKHMPMIKSLMGKAVISISAEKGLSGASPGSSPEYIAIGHMCFESVELFQSSFSKHTREIMSDIPNYTRIKPKIQISEVTL